MTSDEGTLVSAAVYGNHLYIAETPIKNGKLVVHAADFNALLKMEDRDCPDWQKHEIPLDPSVTKHVKMDGAMVKLFTNKIKNTFAKQ